MRRTVRAESSIFPIRRPQIDALLHEVDLAVVEHDFQIEVRVLCENCGSSGMR